MSRRLPLLAALVLLVALVLVALVRVRWDLGPSGAVDVDRDFTPAQQARSAAFHAAVRPPAYASLALGLVVAVLLGLSPWGGRLVARVPGPWTVQVLVGAVLLVVIGRLVTLPLDLLAEHAQRRYGLSRQSDLAWLRVVATSTAVTAVLTALAAVLLVGLARWQPRVWWIFGAAAVAGLVVVGSFLYPVLVQPLFAKTTRLPPGELRTQLLALAQAEGVPVDDVLVADASRRTTALNAYVSGFGSTRRIVVYDTLLQQSPPREVEVVVAHELGHAEEGDVVTGTVLGAFGGAAAVCLVAALLTWSPLLRRAGADGPGDPRVVPLVLAVLAVGTLLAAPGVNLVSRRIEARADLHALEATRDPEAFVAGFRRLGLANLSDLHPPPLVTAFFATHPSIPDRIAYARAWQAEPR
ncbi:MAG: yhfN [Frankiales bacterium]|nr:yhfN [Frankiales bacterium]